MEGFIAALAIIMATIPLAPLPVSPSPQGSQEHDHRIDGVSVNGVVYVDAPIHGVPTYRR